MSKFTVQERRIRDSRLEDGDLDRLKAVLDKGHNIARSDAYALIAEIARLSAELEGARDGLRFGDDGLGPIP